MRNNEESLAIHNGNENWFRRIGESRRSTFTVIGLVLMGSAIVSVLGTPLQFQRFGSLNVGVGVALLILAASRLRRLERQRTLSDLGVIAYEIGRLNVETLDLKNGKAPANSPTAKNQIKAFGNHEEFDYDNAERAETAIAKHEREVRLAMILEFVLIIGGTIQWGFGDCLLISMRTFAL